MAANQSKAFVRAMSSKISITETYRYKAEISDHASMSFMGADGEIKVEFLYDGELQDFRWKLRVAWNGLLKKWEVLKWFRKWLRRFFNLSIIRWITKWLGLRWLWKKIEKIILGSWDDKKFFGIAAIVDAEQYVDRHQTAQVGHLALQGYRKPNFVEDWIENKTLKLKIPIDNLKQKLTQSQKYEICYKYPLQEPETPPVRLQGASLTDEVSNRGNQQIWSNQINDLFEELYSKYDETLQLEIELEIDGGPPNVNTDGKIPADIAKRWWQKSEKSKSKEEDLENQNAGKGKKEETEDKENDGQEEFLFQAQIRCVKGICKVEELVKNLKPLAKRGGYLLILLNKKDHINKLKERLLEAAFQCDPFIPLFETYDYTLYDKPLVVVPVPMVSNRSSSYRPSHLSIESSLQPNFEIVDEIVEGNNAAKLAIALSALANTGGGLVFLKGSQSNEARKETVIEAIRHCQPQLDIQDIELKEIRRDGWIISIKRASSNVHRVDGDVYRWVDGRPKKLSRDETYKLIKDRCILDYPLIMTRPVISHAHIKWPHFSVRETYRVRYDPQKQIIKWSDELQFWQMHNHKFRVRLPLKMNRPIELYNQREIKGEIHIDLKEKLLSRLDIDYFNALGECIPITETKSKVILEFDVVLDPIFRRRLFTTEHRLEFEGVNPDGERLKDIQNMLGNLGLENIKVEPANPLLNDQMIFFTKDPVQKIMENGGYLVKGRKPGLLWVTLHIEGQSIEIFRERAEGDRIDEMSIQTGKTHITIEGRIRGESPHELLVLLNQLQQLLKERFNYVRFQVV